MKLSHYIHVPIEQCNVVFNKGFLAGWCILLEGWDDVDNCDSFAMYMAWDGL